MKQYEKAEMEVVRFNNSFIATSGTCGCNSPNPSAEDLANRPEDTYEYSYFWRYDPEFGVNRWAGRHN